MALFADSSVAIDVDVRSLQQIFYICIKQASTACLNQYLQKKCRRAAYTYN